MKQILAAFAAVSFAIAGCSSMVNPIEIEQPGYEMSPVQLQPSFERCSTKDLDEAIGLAAQIPDARNGCVEVRPLMQFDMPQG